MIRKEKLKSSLKEKQVNWIIEGEELIFKERYNDWKIFVLDCSKSFLSIKLIDSSLEIMTALKSGVSMNDVKEMFKNQNNDPEINCMERNIIFDFAQRGPEFWVATENNKISKERKRIIKEKQEENLKLLEKDSNNYKIKKYS